VRQAEDSEYLVLYGSRSLNIPGHSAPQKFESCGEPKYAVMVAWSGTRLQKIMRLTRTFAGDPRTVSRALPGEIHQWYQWHRRGNNPAVAPEEDWYERLHMLLGAPWPCPKAQWLDEVVTDIGAVLGARGWGFGRDTYGWYADADSSLCRAAWCVALHTRPDTVIETGVAHGVTSRVLLEALRRNDRGHLWSIDLPFPFDHRLHGETGVVVTDACRSRWSYLEGTSKQRLPPLVAYVGHLEMFIHDSLHTAENTLFEMEQAASAMSVGGVMLVDDIDSHQGFATFAKRHPAYQIIICPSADRNGIFGIAVNAAGA
jgi:methyltransferase family protein